jgi:hypothetical protein
MFTHFDLFGQVVERPAALIINAILRLTGAG